MVGLVLAFVTFFDVIRLAVFSPIIILLDLLKGPALTVQGNFLGKQIGFLINYTDNATLKE